MWYNKYNERGGLNPTERRRLKCRGAEKLVKAGLKFVHKMFTNRGLTKRLKSDIIVS
jgi:hypothetical protein